MKKNNLTGSTLKALDVLEYLASVGEATGVTEVSRQVGLDKSTTYRILVTLEHRGYVAQDELTRKYRLGFKFLELYQSASGPMELKKVAGPVLDKLVRDCNETSHLGILDKGEVFYLESRECFQLMKVASHVGLRNPIHCTALGKALLAVLPEEEVELLCKEKGLKRFTDHTLTSLAKLKKELEKIRKSGYAVDNQELYYGTRCLAAPVRNHEGKVIAAVSIAGPSNRVTPDKIKGLSKKVMAAGGEISKLLGYLAH